MKDLTIIAEDGYEYPLFTPSGGIHTVLLDGTGVPTVNRILEKSPLMDGAQDRGFRLEPRQMVLQLMLEGLTEAQTEDLRDQVAYIFSPTTDPLRLRVRRDDDEVRQIDCYLNGLMDFPMSDRTGPGQKIQVPLIAPDPIWYNPVQQSGTGPFDDGSGVVAVNFAGLTWDSWPIIDVTGPATDLLIIHEEAGYNLEFQTPIPSGETFRIDFRPGFKSVRRTSDNANRMSYVNPATIGVFSTFRILSEKAVLSLDPTATVQDFNFAATGTDANSSATMYWYERFISL